MSFRVPSSIKVPTTLSEGGQSTSMILGHQSSYRNPNSESSDYPYRAVCFTGFRDKALETRAEKAGFEVVQTVSSKLTCLVTPNGATKSSEKVKKAETLGIEVIECSVFSMKYLS